MTSLHTLAFWEQRPRRHWVQWNFGKRNWGLIGYRGNLGTETVVSLSTVVFGIRNCGHIGYSDILVEEIVALLGTVVFWGQELWEQELWHPFLLGVIDYI